MDDVDGLPRRRVVDTSNRDVRRALAASIEQIGQWRSEVALLKARAAHFNGAGTDHLFRRIGEVEAGIMEIRTELLLDFADAPQKIKSHSRVVDVERALDNLEATLRDVRGNGDRAVARDQLH
jgi:hypothetical protein